MAAIVHRDTVRQEQHAWLAFLGHIVQFVRVANSLNFLQDGLSLSVVLHPVAGQGDLAHRDDSANDRGEGEDPQRVFDTDERCDTGQELDVTGSHTTDQVQEEQAGKAHEGGQQAQAQAGKSPTAKL